MISNVHMRLIFQVSDDSAGYPKYRTIDIPMGDHMLETMTTPIACAGLGREPAVPIDPDSYLAKELERANVEIERLRAGYGECINDLIDASQHANHLTRRWERVAPIVQRHRDILTGSD